MIDKIVLQGSIYHTEGRARDIQTDEAIAGTSTGVLSNKQPDIDIRRCRQANCCLNYLL